METARLICTHWEPIVYDEGMPDTVKPLRVIGYVRVSTDKQEIGPEVQIDALAAEGARMGWDLAIVREDAASAKSMSNRPVLLAALASLKAKEFDALAVSKLDRISRSVHDFSGLLELSGRQRWALMCLDLNVDTTTITGAAMAQVTVTFAEMERRRIGERTKAGMAKIKANNPGKPMGRSSEQPPEVLARIRELRSTLSMGKTAAVLNADGVPTANTMHRPSANRPAARWHASTIQRIEASAAYRRTTQT